MFVPSLTRALGFIHTCRCIYHRSKLALSASHRQSIEMRLKVTLHEDLGAALMDGVVLCHLANHVRPRSVASIHVPSPAVVSTDKGKWHRMSSVCTELLVKDASGASRNLTAWTLSVGPHPHK